MDANITLTAEQYEKLKEELRQELRGEIHAEVSQGPAYYYSIIREKVFHRFARQDKGYQVNYEAAKAFSCMIRDAFQVGHVYHLTPQQGEAAVRMTDEIINVVDKYTNGLVKE